MDKNIVIIPFAYDEVHYASWRKSDKSTFDMYMKCVIVTCLSARQHSKADIALVTNVERLPEEYERLLRKHQIEIIICPFEEYRFKTDELWYLAFYKLAAFSYVAKTFEYENYCYLDVDVYIQADIDHIWEECKSHIMLYDINHGLQVKDYQIILDEFEKYYQRRVLITHYGGEFFAASRKNALEFIEKCQEVFDTMVEYDIHTTKGDEFIISIAAEGIKEKVKNAGAYIFRQWTGDFYLISTCYRFNQVSFLHLPAEKEDGLVRIFDYIKKNDKLPQNETVWKWTHLTKPSLGSQVRWIKKKIKSIVKQ